MRKATKAKTSTKVKLVALTTGGTALLISLGIGIGSLIGNIKSKNNVFQTDNEDIIIPQYTETLPTTNTDGTQETIVNPVTNETYRQPDESLYETEESVDVPEHVTDSFTSAPSFTDGTETATSVTDGTEAATSIPDSTSASTETNTESSSATSSSTNATEGIIHSTNIYTDRYQEEDIVADANYTNFLSNLTTVYREYFATERPSLANMTITNINDIVIVDNKVVLKGDFISKGQLGNGIFTLENNNQNLKVFSISEGEIDNEELFISLNEILLNNQTVRKASATTKLIISADVDKKLVAKNILKGLTNADEINYLSENYARMEVNYEDSVRCEKKENLYYYYFTVILSDNNHKFTAEFSFVCDSKLAQVSLGKAASDHYQDSKSTPVTKREEPSLINKMLYNSKNASASQVMETETELCR